VVEKEPNPALRAYKQRRSQFSLQILNVTTHGWLRQLQAPCGGGKGFLAYNSEEGAIQVRDAHSLGQLPVRIICAGTAINSPFLPAHTRPALQTAWNHLQSQFLRLSSDAQQTFAPNNGHFVQRDAPEVIVETIRKLL
jgi:pimeloyl-ACP methyl ester carboxylesterase